MYPGVVTGAQLPNEEDPLASENVPWVQVHLGPKSRLLFHTEPGSSAADRYRLLRMRLRELKPKLKLKTLLVTSPSAEDGKSTTIINLATALAKNGKSRVLVIEADLYHPSLAKLVGVRAVKGLANNLEGSLGVFAGIRRLEPLGWYLLPAGQTSTTPTELLSNEKVSELVRKLALHFDWVLIDSPPAIPLADALLLKSCADATLLVARAGRTPRMAIEKCVSLFGRGHVVAVVLNAAEDVNHMYSKYSKYYGRYRQNVGVSE